MIGRVVAGPGGRDTSGREGATDRCVSGPSPIAGAHLIEILAVVIPARNEEQRIGRCLASVNRAIARFAQHFPTVHCTTVVVADRCGDRTAELAARAGAAVVEILSGRVGAARAAGVTSVLANARPDRTWLACTDADSEVPADWLTTHFQAASRGIGLLLGTVRLDPDEAVIELNDSWAARHDFGDGHGHVHGANFGVRGDVYLSAGGFPPVAVHEDVLLAAHVRLQGIAVESTGRSPVLTSARLRGRTPQGLAGYLRALQIDTA